MANAVTGDAPPPGVAVVCCFLNGRRFLAEAIDSVLAQTYPHWTLTLVDDGSTDGASELARTYAARDRRIRYIEHAGHANHGLSASRNAGIAASTGEFVALIDADDWWSPAKLAEQVALMEADPRLGMVCGASVYARAWNGGKDIVVPSGQRFNKPIPPPEALLAVYPLGKGPAPPPSGLLLRRSAIERVGGFEASFRGVFALYEDQAFLAKLYLEEPVLFSNQVWLFYRQHEDSIVASVVAQGRYHEVRRHFLEWFERRLKRHPGIDRRVRVAVWRALLPYRVPGGTWMLRHRPDRRLIGTLRAFRQFLRAGRPIGRVGISASDAPAMPAAEAAPRPEGACLNAATSPCERLPGFRR